ncbi:MAG TPA: hypothetical protein PLC65_07755, partial [Bacteroidia bacterium]|nr:hypothetical protein [Bacteroidia bacterium]
MRFSLLFLFTSFISLSQTGVDDIIASWKTDKALINGTHSFCVMDAKDGTVLKELNAHTSVIPA